MTRHGSIIIVDVGKTMSKMTLWSRDGRLLDRKVRPNETRVQDGMRRLDRTGIESWLVESLASHRDEPVEAIVPVAHGAGVVALGPGGTCVEPLDYEQTIPGSLMREYRQQRDPFALTGSPALPDGLNLGSQLFWLDRTYPQEMKDAVLLPWAQYWAWFLSGMAVGEVTSLGCHSDLWNPVAGKFSPLAMRMGWAERFAPLAGAAEAIGTLRPELAQATGLDRGVRIHTGIHDSNAALMAARGFVEIAEREATIVSTGTWFVAMRLVHRELDLSALSEARDCLINVDPFGQPVPSARFMGGREIETLIGIDTRRIDIKPDQPALMAAVSPVLASKSMILPTLAPGNGPFPDRTYRWRNPLNNTFERRAAVSLYAALVTDASLRLIGARERLLVEGRFAEAEVFVRALASLLPETAVYVANAHNDVSFGALRLLDPGLRRKGELRRVEPLSEDMIEYRRHWYEAITLEPGLGASPA